METLNLLHVQCLWWVYQTYCFTLLCEYAEGAFAELHVDSPLSICLWVCGYVQLNFIPH